MSALAVRSAVASFDIDEARDELASIEAERVTVANAIERGQRQLSAIAEKRRRLAKHGADPDEAAQALLAGEAVDASLGDDEALRREADAVNAGIAALRRREDELSNQRSTVRTQVQQHVAEALVPAVDRLETAAVSAFSELASAYAGAVAIGEVAGGPGSALATALRPVLEAVHRANLVEPGLFATGALETPKAVELALDDHRETVRLAGKQVPRLVPFPVVTAR